MRCRACNNVMQPSEIIWIDERKTHEDLCRHCRQLVSDENPISYEDDMMETDHESVE